ncbi:hypothetical protein P171DRAFT_99100 [Karstenula rhodostoma CBS 690.94]|uniref:Uncharacterized protein n=1 Tax=Karstenula rhodostoma CBS 690.94 TaxID=1392251 RepID=A0A9P4U8R8_9PLEO|nr:hypothetical protein P171DRAFT_99100 [Karstenula rhodostoma CBS 690.94]
MKRHTLLKRTLSHAEERKIMKALERVPARMHPADTTAPPEVPTGEDVGEPEFGDASHKGFEGSKVAGMSLKDRWALWESTLPQKSSVLPFRPRSDHELVKLAAHIWCQNSLGRIKVCSRRIAFVFVSDFISWVLLSGILSGCFGCVAVVASACILGLLGCMPVNVCLGELAVGVNQVAG